MMMVLMLDVTLTERSEVSGRSVSKWLIVILLLATAGSDAAFIIMDGAAINLSLYHIVFCGRFLRFST